MAKSKITLGGTEALLAAAFFFAITNVLVREMATMWGDQAQVAARFALVWVLLAGYALFARKKVSIPRSKIPIAVAYSIGAAVAILFFTLSLQATSIANTLFTSNAVELFVGFLLGTIILKESVTRRKIIAIALALVGLAFYADSLLSGNLGIIFGLLAGVMVGVCNLLAKQLKGVDLNAILRMQFGVGAIFMFGLTFLFSGGDIVRTVSIEGAVVTLIFALVLIIATRLVLYGLQHSDVNVASVVLSSQLAMGAVLGFLFFREVPAAHEIISGVLVTAAAIVAGTGRKPSLKDIPTHS
ncbi:MAG: DMT family transporter [Candidatus Microsaccharimonas sp.]